MSQTAADLLGPAALQTMSGPVLDRSVPALVLKVGQYPIHSGGLGVIRTLGRLGATARRRSSGTRPGGRSRSSWSPSCLR
jgi:hypothetical protein